MNLTINSTRGRILRTAPRGRLAAVQKSSLPPRTTRTERFLLNALILIFVLWPSTGLPAVVAGFSYSFILFAVCGGYILFTRPGTLARVSSDPLFVTAYILLVLGSFIESLHPYASYSQIIRTGQMFAGAMIVASFCRDRPALCSAMHGYLIAGILQAVYLFLTSFNVLSGATATDFTEASLLRKEVFTGTSMNLTPLISANGAIVALALALTAQAPYRRYLFLAISMFCAIASSLPLSRGGIVAMIISLTAVLFSRGIRRGRTILMAGVFGAAIVLCIPNVSWVRFTPSGTHQGYADARARIYIAAIDHFPEYAMTGVGAGNFWGTWGRHSYYAHGPFDVLGSHNVFIQVTIYWGLAGLLALMAVVWQAYRCLPRHCGSDPLSLQLLGLSVAVFITSLTIHDLHAKEFSLILGLLVGAHRWIWPKGVGQTATWKRRLPHPLLARIS